MLNDILLLLAQPFLCMSNQDTQLLHENKFFMSIIYIYRRFKRPINDSRKSILPRFPCSSI